MLGLRTTDRDNGISLEDPATAVDSPAAADGALLPRTSGVEGGTCNLTTTADAVMGGR